MKKEFYFIHHGQTDHHDNDDYRNAGMYFRIVKLSYFSALL